MPLTPEEIQSLMKRNEVLKGIRAMYESLWDEIAIFIFPRRVHAAPGAKKTTELYDSTAVHSNEILAASMHGTLTPSSSVWSTFRLRDERVNNLKEVMDWIEICETQIWMARQQSNYHSEIHEVYLDLPAFGAGCLFIEEKPLNRPGFNGFQYRSFPNTQYCTAENAEGIVDTLFREFELSAGAAIKKWGEDPKVIGEKIVAAKDKDPDKKFQFLHCVYPSENGGKPFTSYYIALDEKIMVEEGGYYEFPYIVPRWSKDSGEEYGTGPGRTALPDSATLNKAKEFGLKAWAKDLDPPTFETDGGVIGSLKLMSGGRNVARGKDHIWTLDRKARYDVSQIKEEALRQSIKEIFYSDQLSLPDKSNMREMEIAVRYELMQRLLGPTIGRYEREGLNPQIEREFGLMMRASSGRYPALPPPPPILAQLGITDIDIEYEGPLAKAQRMSELTGMQKLVEFGGALVQVKPEVFDNLDGDKAFRDAAEIAGVSSATLLSDEEVEVIRVARRKAQAEEQRKQDMERLASGIKDVSPAIKAMTEAEGEGA